MWCCGGVTCERMGSPRKVMIEGSKSERAALFHTSAYNNLVGHLANLPAWALDFWAPMGSTVAA
jgi:hypothetical protein